MTPDTLLDSMIYQFFVYLGIGVCNTLATTSAQMMLSRHYILWFKKKCNGIDSMRFLFFHLE